MAARPSSSPARQAGLRACLAGRAVARSTCSASGRWAWSTPCSAKSRERHHLPVAQRRLHPATGPRAEEATTSVSALAEKSTSRAERIKSDEPWTETERRAGHRGEKVH